MLGRVYRPHCVRSVLTTSVKILPYRPPARLIRAKSILPNITYCQRVWHFAKAPEKKDNRTCAGESFTPCHSRQDVLILMNKVKHGMAPSYLCDLFSRSNKRYNLRNSDFEMPSFTVRSLKPGPPRQRKPIRWQNLNNRLQHF